MGWLILGLVVALYVVAALFLRDASTSAINWLIYLAIGLVILLALAGPHLGGSDQTDCRDTRFFSTC